VIEFTDIKFKRSVQSIQCYTMASDPHKPLMACLIQRELHVYNVEGNFLLFRTSVPSGVNQGSSGSPAARLFFLDNDCIVALQCGRRRILFVSVAA
jgi:hypothetical protein